MNQTNLKKLLLEYERKRNIEILDAEERKIKIYKKNPRLQEIDNELSKFAILTVKKELKGHSEENVNDLHKKIEKLRKEKDEILESLKIDNSYFLPDYECKTCKDTGYITQNFKTTMCNCLKQKLLDFEYNTYNSYNIQNNTFNGFSLNLYSDEANEAKYASKISPKQNMEKIEKKAKDFINKFDDKSEKNLLFFGNSGLGKTFLSNCIANSLLNKGKTVMYQTAPIMLDSIINFKLREK